MCQFVHETEGLPGFGGAIVSVDEWESVIQQAKTGNIFLFEGCFKNEYTTVLYCLPLLLEGEVVIFPFDLVF